MMGTMKTTYRTARRCIGMATFSCISKITPTHLNAATNGLTFSLLQLPFCYDIARGLEKKLEKMLRPTVFPALPRTQRATAFALGGDPKGKNFLYCFGQSVIIRDIENPAISDVYTQHVAKTTVAKYAPSGFYISSAVSLKSISVCAAVPLLALFLPHNNWWQRPILPSIFYPRHGSRTTFDSPRDPPPPPPPPSFDGSDDFQFWSQQFDAWAESQPLDDPCSEAAPPPHLPHRRSVRLLHRTAGRYQRPQYESHLISELCTRLGIRKTRTSPYHPQADGQVERFNRTMKDILAKCLAGRENDWDRILPHVALAYNTSRHTTSKRSPFYLVHGREAHLPVDVACQLPATTAHLADLTTAITSVRDAIAQSHQTQDQHQAPRINYHQYRVGDRVWLHHPPLALYKLRLPWTGPFTVMATLPPGEPAPILYRIQHDTGRQRQQVVHHNRLKPYIAPTRRLLPHTYPICIWICL
ncbi:WDR1 [Branchiostoma lanceolatum]|uniref:WDR1 protein n=1 Tax=Branchiostoma lanceolatum TaxID=7740 RepID=A0A8K0EN73_BRALA|nr:WDR1 [Branchiostoma lanceolatum]